MIVKRTMAVIGDIDFITLRDYVDTMFTEKEKALQAALLAQEKAVSAALMASDKAISKAEANAEKWRENANEWRGAMSDRDRELPSRREVETSLRAIETQMRPVVAAMNESHGGRQTAGDWRTWIIGLLVLVSAISPHIR